MSPSASYTTVPPSTRGSGPQRILYLYLPWLRRHQLHVKLAVTILPRGE